MAYFNDTRIEIEAEKAKDVYEMISRCEHPNLLKLYEVVVIKNEVFTFMDLYSDGDLVKFVRKDIKQGKLLEEKWLKKQFYGIRDGLRYMHKRRMVHRDMKPDNILVVRDELRSVIADFEMVEEEPVGQTTSEYACGMIIYRSPGILASEVYDPYCADVWATGCVYYFMLTGREPFYFRDPKFVYKMKNAKF